MHTEQRKSKRKLISNLLKVGVTAVGLYLVFRQIDFRQTIEILLQANIYWLGGSFLLVNLGLIVRAYRWQLLLQGLGVKISFRRLVNLYFVGNFFNSFLPSGFGGDVVRILEITRDVSADVAAGTVILDRLSGLLMLFVMALVALPLQSVTLPQNLFMMLVLGAIAGTTGGFLVLDGRLLRRFGQWLPAPLSPVGDGPVARLLKAVQGCGWPAVWAALGVSTIFNLMLALWWYMVGRGLGLHNVPFVFYLVVIPVLSVALLIPSISGLGPRELLAPTLFAAAGVSAETAVSLSLIIFILMRIASLLGAPLYLISLFRPHPTTKEQQIP